MATNFFVAQGSQLYIMDVTISPHVVVLAAQLQGLSGIGGAASSIKLSNFDSPGYEEYAKGLVDPGKPSGNVVTDMNSAGHQLLKKLLGLGQTSQTSFFYGLADAATAPTVTAGVLLAPRVTSPTSAFSRSGWLFSGFVAEFSQSNSVNNILMGKLTIQASGAIQMCVKGQTTAF